jgi:hypothetical protein
LLALAVACAVVALAGLLPPGASAQQKSGAGSKARASAKVAPGARNPARAKERRAKAAAALDRLSPQALNCVDTPISFPQTVTGTLTQADCKLPDGSSFDSYTFNGTAGQQIVITMKSANYSSTDPTTLDPYLFLMRPGETTISVDPNITIQDDDSAGVPDALIPSTDPDLITPSFNGTLPTTGTYTIIANSFDAGETGGYTLSLAGPCTPQQVAITPVAGTTVTTNGTLSSTDCRDPGDGSFFDVFTFNAAAGQQIAIQMNASAFNPFLFLVGPDGDELFRDDVDTPHVGSTRLPPGSGIVRLPQTGTYRIIANSFSPGSTGSYAVLLALDNNSCPSSPITVGATVNGVLATTDCRLPVDSSFIDVYTFSGTAGQSISVSMSTTAPGLDPYLLLLSPTGSIIAEDDDAGGAPNARIPTGGGTFTLPAPGTYTIYANSSVAGMTGAYTLTLGGAQVCTYALTAAGHSVAAGGGTFTDSFTTQPGCAAPAIASNAAFITSATATGGASGSGTFTYTVQANATSAARTGTLTVGGQTFTVTQGAGGAGACDVAIYPPVQPFTQDGGTGRFTVFPAAQCSWTATTTTPWIAITSPSGAADGTGRVRYTVAPNTTSATRTGTIIVNARTYVVTQTSAATTPQVQFSNATYSVQENDATKSITITVSRIGDTGGAATVEYRTVDNPAVVPCDPNATSQRGTAFARCDYATNLDTLTFDIGQSVKTFTIPLINDAHVEGNETFQIALQNPQGASPGSQQTATVTIVDDDTAQSNTNPINQTPLFIRMQYLDFLSREPEGGEPWSAVINGCPNPFNRANNDPSANCDRIKVSAAFFGSQEFQLKGFFVFLYYKVSFGSQATPNFVPQYDEIVPDMRRITGASTEERVDKTFNFAEDWVTRPAFVARYGSKTNAQFVDELLSNVGATLASADPVSGVTRNSLVADLNAGTKSRADVLRLIVESREVNAVQTNHAFVAMQYYGYLRRTPEPGGYLAWLNTINPPTSANPRDMVNGFLNSDEYFLRFGPNVRQ